MKSVQFTVQVHKYRFLRFFRSPLHTLEPSSTLRTHVWSLTFVILDGSASDTQLHRLQSRWRGKKLKSLFQFFVSVFKETLNSSVFFFSQVVLLLAFTELFQISKLLKTSNINWVSDWMNCLQYTLKHYSDDFYNIYIPICMNVYLELFWVLFKLTCSFKKFICSATLRLLYLPLYFKICLSTLLFKIVFLSQNYACNLMGSFLNCSFDRVQNYIILYQKTKNYIILYKVGRSCGRFFCTFLVYVYLYLKNFFRHRFCKFVCGPKESITWYMYLQVLLFRRGGKKIVFRKSCNLC